MVDPQSFIQTNTLVAENLYSTAREWAKKIYAEDFLDLFCGFGPFSFHLKEKNNSGLGVEINPNAIKSANYLKEKLKITGLDFESRDAQLMDELNLDSDLVVVNPPRAGLKNSITFILRDLPKNILYSSCNIESLKTDVELLQAHYKIKKIKLFDMFPHTKHFETLMLLERSI